MHILLWEIRKIINNKSILAIAMILILLNVFSAFYIYNSNAKSAYNSNFKLYKSESDKISSMSLENAEDYILEKMNDSELSSEDAALYATLLNEITSCVEYPEYVKKIIDNADVIMNSEISNSSSYSYKNCIKLRSDYEKVNTTEMTYGPMCGIEKFFESFHSDLFVIIFVMLVCIRLIIDERNNKELGLYKTTYNGGVGLCLAKLISIIICTVVISFIFVLSDYLIANYMFGFGDTNRLMCSVLDFRSLNSEISIEDALKQYMLDKLLAYVLFAVIMLLISILPFGKVEFYVCSVSVTVLGLILYYAIPSNSTYNFFKYCTPYGLMRTENFFKYQNINLFNRPVTYNVLAISLIGIITFVVMYLYVCLFTDINEGNIRIRKFPSIMALIRKFSMKIKFYENYKLYISGKGLLIIIILGFITIIGNKSLDEEFYVSSDPYYDVYINEITDMNEDEIESFLENEESRYNKAENDYLSGTITETAYNDIMKSYDAYELIAYQKWPYISEKKAKFIKEYGYKLLTGDSSSGTKDIRMAMISVIFMMFPLAFIICVDYETGMYKLIGATLSGKKKVLRNKFLTGIGYISIIYAIAYLPFYVKVLSKYGIADITSKACCMEHLENVPGIVNILTYIIGVAVMRYAGYILMYLIIMLISGWTKNVLNTCFLGCLFFLMPLMMSYLGIPGVRYMLLNPLFIGNVF